MSKLVSQNKKYGFSLIEVMIAVLVLAVLVLGSAAVVYRAGGGIQRQQNKRETIVAANQVLEIFWNMTYADLKGKYAGGSPIARTQLVNGNSLNASVVISEEKTDSHGEQYIEITLDLDHRGGTDDIVFVTRRYEFGLNGASL